LSHFQTNFNQSTLTQYITITDAGRVSGHSGQIFVW